MRIKMTYIYEREGWPKLVWSHERLTGLLIAVRYRQGRLIGQMEGLGFSLRNEAALRTLTQDVIKTSDIEGEKLDRDQVRSSIARRLGLDIGALVPSDRHVEGVVDMTLDATQQHAAPLTKQRLFAWHAALFPTGHSGLSKIVTGKWRDDRAGPMQVVSGPIGREKVHYRAPASDRVPAEMQAFLKWFNAPADIDPVLKAALAHLRFVTVHPFEDGNGRIARAIADMALARSEECPQRFYSMSAQIRQERTAYYDMLEQTQQGGLDVTDWLEWFLGCLDRALARAHETLASVRSKARFWEAYAAVPLNGRQRLVINRLLDGFEGKLTSTKWAKLTKCSQDTASRDIAALLKDGMLVKEPGGGRSTSYALNTPCC
jgi:Fic family protein